MSRQVTTEEFIEKAKKIHDNKYDYDQVIYINNKTKIKIYCKKCQKYFMQAPRVHLQASGCSFCAGKNKTTLSIIKEFKKIHKNKYDYSKVNYINAKSKVEIICPKHGSFFQIPDSHRKGAGCEKCGIESRVVKKTKPLNQFIKEAKEVHGDRYDYSEVKYKTCNIKIKIYCKEHKIYFYQTPSNHLKGQGCFQCGQDKIKVYIETTKQLSYKQFIIKAKKLHGNKFDYSKVSYESCKLKVKLYCNKCNKYFMQTPNDHLRLRNCPKCSGYHKTTKELIDEFKKVHKDRYDYSLVNFNGMQKKAKIICKEHGVFEQRINAHNSGQGCPKCRNSKGETKVENWLKENKINYKSQLRIKECKNIRSLPFDFAVFIEKDNLKTLIEYDGKQHYEAYGYGDKHKMKMKLKEIQLHDSIKTNYCLENNIKLIRIPYTDFDSIEKILNKELL